MSTNGILDFQNTNKIIFRGSDSNVVIDTSNVSLGIGIQGTETPGSNLHVVGNAFISSDLTVSGDVTVSSNLTVSGNVSDLNVVSNVNMLHTSNTAALKVNSNVVTEFSRSKKLIKYPRVAMTQDDESSTTGYVADASTEETNNTGPWKAFNGDGSAWETTPQRFIPSTGDWDGTTAPPYAILLVGGTTIYGEWVELKIPNKIQLHTCRIAPMTHSTHTNLGKHRSPRDGYILGRVGSTGNWTVLKSWSGLIGGWEDLVLRDFNIENPLEYYDYFRVVWTAINGNNNYSISAGDGYASAGEIEFLGIPEYDPEAHGTDVTVKSVANVPNTDWLEVYYDAKGLPTGGVTTVTALGGTAISATTLGDPQVSNEAFVFDGSGDAIVSGATSFSGSPTLSYSVWFKTNSILSGTRSNSIVMIGHATGTKSLGFRIKGTGETNRPGNYRFYVYGGATNESVDTDIKAQIGIWTHATIVRDGLNMKLYIDGKFADENTNATTDLVLNSGARVALGNYIDSNGAVAIISANDSYDGSIANFRLFNRALTSDEIYQLYAYQKEDFGHGDLSMTLKAGRLGIGTSEPRAALDVRGDIYRNGVPAFPIPTAHFYKQSTSTTGATHYENIRSGWVAMTHAHVTVPGVIEAHQLTGANYNTDEGNSGLAVKLCKEGLYKIQFSCSLSTQSAINSHIGIYIRPITETSYVSGNTGTDYIGLGDANGYAVINAATGSSNAHLFHRFEIIKVTKAPGYAFVSMTPNSNNDSHFRFENYGATPYAVMNVMYLG